MKRGMLDRNATKARHRIYLVGQHSFSFGHLYSNTNNESKVDALTHLNYAFAFLDPNTFRITTMDAATPVSLFDHFSELKFTNPDLKLFASVGGGLSLTTGHTQPIFGNIAKSASNRQKFADEVLSFLDYYGFDGIDID